MILSVHVYSRTVSQKVALVPFVITTMPTGRGLVAYFTKFVVIPHTSSGYVFVDVPFFLRQIM